MTVTRRSCRLRLPTSRQQPGGRMTELTTNHFLFLSAALFVIGLMGVPHSSQPADHVHVRRADDECGQSQPGCVCPRDDTVFGEGFVIFTIAVAAAEAAVGLAIILALSRRRLPSTPTSSTPCATDPRIHRLRKTALEIESGLFLRSG